MVHMDHFYSGLLFLIVLQQGSGHDSPGSFFSSARGWESVHVQWQSKRQEWAQPTDTTETLFWIQDDFEESVWPYATGMPVQWIGDLDHFRLHSPDSGNTVLKLDSPFAGYSALYVKQAGTTGQWRATIHQDFTPSNTNQTWFYLMADQPLESATINGYAMRFGENGSEKRIRLFRIDNGAAKEISRIPLPLTDGGYEVRITRDADDNWFTEARSLVEDQWIQGSRTHDSIHQVSHYTGFYFTYSTTRTDKFWVDNVDIRTFPGAFVLDSARFKNQSHLQFKFNQPVRAVAKDQILLKDSTEMQFKADSMHIDNEIMDIYFQPLPEGRYEFRLDVFKSLQGTGLSQDQIFLELKNPFNILQASIRDEHHVELRLSRPANLDVRSSPVNLTKSYPRQSDQPPLVFLSDRHSNSESTEIRGDNPLQIRYEEPIGFGKYLLRFHQIIDEDGWILRDSLYPVYRYYPPEFGALQMNEVLFNPLSDPDDGYVDQTQYLELHNTTPYPISAKGLFYHKGSDETGAIRPFRLTCDECSTFSPHGVIPPNGYVLIYPESESTGFKSSRLGHYLESVRKDIVQDAGKWPFYSLNPIEEIGSYDYPFMTLALRYQAKTLSLANSGSLLILQNEQTILDSIYYSQEWHHRALPVLRGYALERIQSGLSGLRKDNWGTSASRSGGTPGWENSIHTQISNPLFEANWIVASPNPFSPNDDGFEDHLQISYQLDVTDYALRVRVFDIEGRFVRSLFLGRAGTKGVFLWDGRNEQGLRIPVGLYLILAEATGSETARDLVVKLPLVVAGATRIP